jgi:TonB family protein
MAVSAQQLFWPAQYRGGPIPQLPKTAVGGGEVILELTVDAAGRVTAVAPLRTTPPFADSLAEAARAWQFTPAEELAASDTGRAESTPLRAAVASKVLVAGVYRPPALNTPTLGEAPRDVAPASDDVPLPVSIVAPPYPPTALNGGVVLLEAQIGADGAVTSATVVRSAPPFDAAAHAALLQWRFRPARWRGRAVASIAYAIFGFAVPIA